MKQIRRKKKLILQDIVISALLLIGVVAILVFRIPGYEMAGPAACCFGYTFIESVSRLKILDERIFNMEHR